VSFMGNVISWAEEFWIREHETNREYAISMDRLYVIKKEVSGVSVNSAGFKTVYLDVSGAAKAVGVDWDELDTLLRKGTVFVTKFESGKVRMH